MTKEQFEKDVLHHMKVLKLTREEAEQLVRDDEEVDKMSMKELSSDLSTEQKQIAKKMTKTGTKKPTNYKFETKTKKKDEEKEDFVRKLAELLPKLSENVEIVNANREISFNLGENSYSLTLTKHRTTRK